MIRISDLEMQISLSPGRPIDMEVRKLIPTALKNIRMGTQEAVRRELYNILGRNVSWHTVNKHLDYLVRKGYVEKRIITRGTVRTITVFSLPA